jgi:putative PEP-CTERM system histidine kinase
VTATASALLHGAAAGFCLLWAVLAASLAIGREKVPLALAAASAVAAFWAAAVSLAPDAPLEGLAGAAETLRAAAGYTLLLALYRRAGGVAATGPVLRFGVTGALLAAIGMLALLPGMAEPLALPTLGSPVVLARLGLAFTTVLLAENLFRNADETARWHVNLPAIAFACLAVMDILIYADAALTRRFSPELIDARAILTPLALSLLVVAALRVRRWRRSLRVSREAVFHGATLVIGGAFLLGVGVAGEALRQIGGDWTRAAQVSLLAGAGLALAVVVASQSARSRIRHLVVEHFFAGRYDYRREWLRCVDTLAGEDAVTEAPVRAIRAIADPADSPGGVLLLREGVEADPAARFLWHGAWNMPEATGLALPPSHALVTATREGGWVASFADAAPPADLAAVFGRLWLAVPLVHHREGLIGFVLLRPPRAPFTLDKESFDLLRMIGREVSVFLAERRAALHVADQRRLQEYAKRFAFVAHDVKTVGSQLSLLLANAEENIADPEFQSDMLLTVRAAADRIDTLIARLRRPEAEAAGAPAAKPPAVATGDLPPGRAQAEEAPRVAVLPRLAALAASRRHPVRVEAEGDDPGEAALAPVRFDEAVTHLLDNAIEASTAGEPVLIRVRRSEGGIVIDITDRGPGMTAEFVRDSLFRPLSTSKPQGSGIGAWQSRELLREAGGDLTVLTRPGVGTTMRMALPAYGGMSIARRLSA